MRKTLFGLMSVAAVFAAAPAWGQDVYVGPGRGGIDVGVGPRHDGDWRDRRSTYGAAPSDCRTVRERIETPSGRVIFRTRRECR